MNRIVIVDFGMGNIGSIVKKIQRVGGTPVVSSNGSEISSASRIILPGVGHFASAVRKLHALNIWDSLNEVVLEKGTPILGICLGMQLMANFSDEGNERGFGWIDAGVVRFDMKDKATFKVPHMGWNNVELKRSSPIFNDVDLRPGFYFVHSYHMKCHKQEDILGLTDYSFPFVSAIQRKNIIGVQFHPEKSHESGERMFYNFTNL